MIRQHVFNPVNLLIQVGIKIAELVAEDRNDLNGFDSVVCDQCYLVTGFKVAPELSEVSPYFHASLHLCVNIPYCPCPISGHLTTLSE